MVVKILLPARLTAYAPVHNSFRLVLGRQLERHPLNSHCRARQRCCVTAAVSLDGKPREDTDANTSLRGVRAGLTSSAASSTESESATAAAAAAAAAAQAATAAAQTAQDAAVMAAAASGATDDNSHSGQTAFFNMPAVPQDVLTEFESKLEADVQTVAVTLTAVLGVIIFWRGVWALLDHYIGDSVFGDICCALVGLCIVLYIRLSGLRIASFWPPS